MSGEDKYNKPTVHLAGESTPPESPAPTRVMPSANSPETGLPPYTLVNNRFEVRTRLGRGGMGDVYLVYDQKLEKARAMKVILPELVANGDMRQRFLREVAVAQALSHDGIVRVHDFGEDPVTQLHYFTMEHVEGEDLARYLEARGGRLPFREAITLLEAICDPLQYAHDKDVVHRDLKLQNIMRRPDGRIVLLDFGLARFRSQDALLHSNRVCGTPGYMAPEQRSNPGAVDRRTDVYALGVILYQLLTGEIPLGAFAPASSTDTTIPAGTDAIIEKCLATRQEDRYQSVAELQAALAGLGAARPRTIPRRAMLVAAGALALALGCGYFFYQHPSRGEQSTAVHALLDNWEAAMLAGDTAALQKLIGAVEPPEGVRIMGFFTN
ncbi:MAG: serine/threonine protein kinase, partial [Candidatus Hydrogenedentes bacterium]|nr:serine/threonine protein kinase [Candidatus Hydrogenedentota bacterium]